MFLEKFKPPTTYEFQFPGKKNVEQGYVWSKIIVCSILDSKLAK